MLAPALTMYNIKFAQRHFENLETLSQQEQQQQSPTQEDEQQSPQQQPSPPIPHPQQKTHQQTMFR